MDKISPDDVANIDEIFLIQDLECSIDGSVPLNPVMCKKCENIFCKDCIDTWKQKSSACPMRCQPMELVSTDKSIIKQQLLKIKLWCPNKDKGCTEKVLINDLQKHEKLCEYRLVNCLKCNSEVPSAKLIDHQFTSCIKNRIVCFSCSTEFNLGSLVSHLDDCKSKLATQTCQSCGAFNNAFNHICEIQIGTCEKCKLPDIQNDIINGFHKCIEPDNSKKINAHFKNITFKLENYQQSFLRKKDESHGLFISKLNELTAEFDKKESEKVQVFEGKLLKAQEEGGRKFDLIKKEKYENIKKVQAEIKEKEASLKSIFKKLICRFGKRTIK
jgi:hypothetical protein